MRRDVTVLLSVDGDNGLGAEPRDAVAAISVGHQAVVHDDATAVLVLTLLGLTKAAAVDQVRSSYGPLLDSAHPRLRHLVEMANGSTIGDCN